MIGWRYEIIIEEAELRQKAMVGGYLLPSISFILASSSVSNLAAAILPYIDGKIKEINLIAMLELPNNNPSSAADYSEVERKATFIWKANGKRTRFSIPTVKADSFKDNDIHVTDAFLEAVANVVLAGPFCNSNFVAINEVVKGIEAFGKKS